MKAYLIDPLAQTVIEVDYKNEGMPLQHAYELIGFGCEMVELVYLNQQDDAIFVDEGGLVAGNPHEKGFFQVTGDAGRVELCGRGVVLGCNDKGETIAPRASLEDVAKMITWLGSLR